MARGLIRALDFFFLPMILIQEIRSVWTKASRGAAAAALRNSVPEVALFPVISSKSMAHQILHQIIVYGETNDFAEPLKSEITALASASISIGCVKIKVSSSQIIVAYEYDYKSGGLPPRHRTPGVNLKEEVIVEPESWVRIKYNGRFSGDEWRYEKVVVNVGLFQKYEAGVFYSNDPTSEVTHLAELR
jgi:hypothetical protein